MKYCCNAWLRIKNINVDIILKIVNLDLTNKTILGRWETENVRVWKMYYTAK